MTSIQKIFISYRQSDNRAFVVRIRDWLVNKYGRDNVFMDFDTLPPFVNFEDYIKQRIAASDIVLAIIGPNWLQAFADKASEDEKDYMLIELESALKSGKRIVPMLIVDAQMPRRKDVPEGLRSICDYNAANLRDDKSFYDEIERVIAALESMHATVTVQTTSNTVGLGQSRHTLTGEEHFNRGLERHQKGDYEGAIADLKAALKLGTAGSSEIVKWIEDAEQKLKGR